MTMFSDCSGSCCTCSCNGGCLAGHGDDHYYLADAATIVDRLNGGKYTSDEAELISFLKDRYGITYKAGMELEHSKRKTLSEVLDEYK